MAITGQILSRLLDEQVDKAYSGYLDPAKKNRLFNKAFTEVIEKKYRGLDTQQEYDELSNLIKIDQPFIPRNGFVATSPYLITSLVYNSVTGLATVTTGTNHLIQVNDIIEVSGVLGFTPPINGTFLVLLITNNTIVFTAPAGATGAYVANSGKIIGGPMIPNYHHFLSARCNYLISDRYINANIVAASNLAPIVIKTKQKTDLRTFQRVSISGVNGNTAANGVFFIKRYSYDTFALYQDEALTIPVVGNGTYVNGGTIGSFLRRMATQLTPDSKGAPINRPNNFFPSYQVTDNKLFFSPIPQGVSIDYISDIEYQIDVNDGVLDLSLIYPEKLLYRLVNDAARQFNLETRDLSQYNAQASETIQNP